MIYVVDDDEFICDTLTLMLGEEGYPAKSFTNPFSFLDQIDSLRDGCLILDVNMPGMDGLTLQDELKKRGVHLPILFLSGHGSIPVAARTIRAGAIDFMTNPLERNLLLEKIREATHSKSFEKGTRLSSLTPREREIMQLTVEGLTSKMIAKQLGISYKTVQIHRFHIMKKAGVSNTMELARLALRKK